MGFDRLKFTKEWTDHAAFPTVETDEAKVRADMQVLHDEAKAALNRLIDALEAAESAAKLGAVGPQGENSTVQKELDGLHDGMIKAGALPVGGSVEQMLVKSSEENYDTRWGGLSDIGAAAEKHFHSAEEITGGILALARGGTGVASLAELATALGMPKVVTGTYTGNGVYVSEGISSTTQKISLGFTPKAVLVAPKGNFWEDGITKGPFGGLAVTGNPAENNTVKIVNGGFEVLYYYYRGSSTDHYSANDNGKVYHYIAFA